jgi:thioredoxin 2
MNNTAHLTADDQGILMPCLHCQSVNRIRFSHLHENGRCGVCKTPLPQAALPVEVGSAASFNALIRGASLPVLVDFWAPWCGPCRMVAPEVAKLAQLATGELLIVKVNTEDRQDIARSMGIQSIPTFAVFFRGREVNRTSGAASAVQLRDFALNAIR